MSDSRCDDGCVDVLKKTCKHREVDPARMAQTQGPANDIQVVLAHGRQVPASRGAVCTPLMDGSLLFGCFAKKDGGGGLKTYCALSDLSELLWAGMDVDNVRLIGTVVSNPSGFGDRPGPAMSVTLRAGRDSLPYWDGILVRPGDQIGVCFASIDTGGGGTKQLGRTADGSPWIVVFSVAMTGVPVSMGELLSAYPCHDAAGVRRASENITLHMWSAGEMHTSRIVKSVRSSGVMRHALFSRARFDQCRMDVFRTRIYVMPTKMALRLFRLETEFAKSDREVTFMEQCCGLVPRFRDFLNDQPPSEIPELEEYIIRMCSEEMIEDSAGVRMNADNVSVGYLTDTLLDLCNGATTYLEPDDSAEESEADVEVAHVAPIRRSKPPAGGTGVAVGVSLPHIDFGESVGNGLADEYVSRSDAKKKAQQANRARRGVTRTWSNARTASKKLKDALKSSSRTVSKKDPIALSSP